MDIEHISISREGVWRTCPQKYKYKYHLKLKSDEEVPDYFTYGKVIHTICELYILSRGNENINLITEKVLSGEREYDYGMCKPKLTREQRNNLSEHLFHFMKLNDKIGVEGKVEWLFKKDLDPPHGKFVTGLIDRIIVKDDKFFLLDYKTSKNNKWRKNRNTILFDLQLQCYCWVIKEQFGIDSHKIKAALYYTEDGTLVPVQFSSKTLDSTRERLLKVYNDIKATHPDKVTGNVGSHCYRCEYKGICPYFNKHNLPLSQLYNSKLKKLQR